MLKVTNAQPGFLPPQVVPLRTTIDESRGITVLEAELMRLGSDDTVQARFQYRRKQRVDELYDNPEPWIDTPPMPLRENGRFQAGVSGLERETQYEYRVLVVHPKITVTSQRRDITP